MDTLMMHSTVAAETMKAAEAAEAAASATAPLPAGTTLALFPALSDPRAWPLELVVRNAASGGLDRYLARFLDYRDDLAAATNCLVLSIPRQVVEEAAAKHAATVVAGSLIGVPFVVKDCIEVADTPLTGGMSKTFFDHCVSTTDAPVIAALKAAGAVVIGKANLPDLHLGLSVDSSSFGRVKHPWFPESLNAIGSSGGVAAAVVTGVAAFGIGTDTGGCIRIPAALCGAAGFRPSEGRYSTRGMLHQCVSRDAIGPIARTVADIQIIDDAIVRHHAHTGEETLASGGSGAAAGGAGLSTSGGGGLLSAVKHGVEKLVGRQLVGTHIEPSELKAASLAGLRVGICREHFFEDLDGDVTRVMEGVLLQLRKEGAIIVEASFLPGQEPWVIDRDVGEPLRAFEILRDVSQYLTAHGSRRSVLDIVESFPGTPADKDMLRSSASADTAVAFAAYRAALSIHRPRLQAAFADYFQRHAIDVMLYPTAALPARKLNPDGTVTLNGRSLPTYATYTRNTAATGNAGLPAVSFAAGLTAAGEGGVRLPVGVELTAPHGEDVRLLAVARALQESLPQLRLP